LGLIEFEGFVEEGLYLAPFFRAKHEESGRLWRGRGGEGGIEPGDGEEPIAFGGAGMDFEEIANFVEGEAAEATEFNDAGGAGILGGEVGEEFIEVQELFDAGGGAGDIAMEGEPFESATAFGGTVGAGMIDEQAAHGGGGDGKEVFATAPEKVVLTCHTEEEFVDEGGGLECMILTFAGHTVGGYLAQFGVDDIEKATANLWFAPMAKKFRHLTGAGIGHPSSLSVSWK
jgi:hypothetical protein